MRWLVTVVILMISQTAMSQTTQPTLRPPAVPLVTHDPYFSCWSFADNLYDDWPRHWTGAIHGMCGLIRVDGKTMRWMGAWPRVKETVKQKSVTVTATTTEYVFECGPVDLTAKFVSPLRDGMSPPITQMFMQARARDGKAHQVELYFDATAEWCVNKSDQQVHWSHAGGEHFGVMRISHHGAEPLSSKGDDHRIDWGSFSVASSAPGSKLAITSDRRGRDTFTSTGGPVESDDSDMPRAANKNWPVLSVVCDLGQVSEEVVQRRATLSYNDEFSIQYFGQNLIAAWRASSNPNVRNAADATDPTSTSDLDRRIAEDSFRAGAEKYAQLCQLAYRQAMAAHKLVTGPKGELFMFSKENFSNGCIGTVDVTYPSIPLFLCYNPKLAEALCDPIFDYVESGRWTKPYAPHDLGTYPLANGQVYGEDMPVEECGNMLILAGAICVVEKDAAYAKRHWKTLTQWCDYLKAAGFDPKNQLCTDDFAGHLARNTNLSIKAILGIACYGRMAEMMGEKQLADEHTKLARDLARKWCEMARVGDHYALTFDDPVNGKDTWSQKYNLVWDKVLKLNIFPPEVARDEVKYYLTKQNKYGLPLDSRKSYTKSDWIMWTATLAESREDFEALINPVWDYVNETPDRCPISDWHETTNARVVGFRARSVVGGYFMKVLDEKLNGPR